MFQSDDLIPATLRPDLQEFLEALNGFLTNPTSPGDPNYVKFLEIFFQTIKSSKGHLLKASPSGELVSVVSYGIGDDFDKQFNEAHARYSSDPCPLDFCLKENDTVAIVDLSKDTDIPSWFMKIMDKYEFNALVAVPLVGRSSTMGILCAYYQDACLFDKGTLDHLMMMGRMVGGATETSMVANQAEMHGKKEQALDQLLNILTSTTMGKGDVYSLLTKMVKDACGADGAFAGPLVSTSPLMTMRIESSIGLDQPVQPKAYPLPPFFGRAYSRGDTNPLYFHLQAPQWGEMASFFYEVPLSVLFVPVQIAQQLKGVLFAWRRRVPIFEEEEKMLATRLTCIASLALKNL